MKKHNFAELKTPPYCCDHVKKPCTVGQVTVFKGAKQENIQNEVRRKEKAWGFQLCSLHHHTNCFESNSWRKREAQEQKAAKLPASKMATSWAL